MTPASSSNRPKDIYCECQAQRAARHAASDRFAAQPASVRQLQPAGLFTIKEVGDACGLPQPVVAQLVPRTWTDAGWMYTAAAWAYAVQIAPDVREGRYVPPQSEHGEPQSMGKHHDDIGRAGT